MNTAPEALAGQTLYRYRAIIGTGKTVRECAGTFSPNVDLTPEVFRQFEPRHLLPLVIRQGILERHPDAVIEWLKVTSADGRHSVCVSAIGGCGPEGSSC